MMRMRNVMSLVLMSLLVSPTMAIECSGWECLQEYAFREDGAYSWTDTEHRLRVEPDSEGKGGWRGYFLNFTSQKWLTEEEVSRSEWWHILVVIVPDVIEVKDTTMLWITDGGNNDDFPDLLDYNLLVAGEFATTNRVVTASLFQTPNQPIRFALDPMPGSRSADAIIAFTWWLKFTQPETDTDYILQLPMCKAGVKALDTVENFLTSPTAPPEVRALGLTPTRHIVSGASKRGWTTWHVGAVDPRVMAIAPVVMDELNFVDNIKHHYRSLGGWSFALKDYWRMNLTAYFTNPEIQVEFDIVDPYVYRDKILMPKLVCNSAGDEFFVPDNIRWWWEDMPMYQEMNRFLTLPNGEHTTATAILELLPAVNTWVRSMLDGSKRLGPRPAPTSIEERNTESLKLMRAAQVPRYNWSISASGEEITVMADRAPLAVNLWHSSTCMAHANKRKDFRLVNYDSPCTCGIQYEHYCVNLAVLWTSIQLKETSPGSLTWVARWPAPTTGQWSAFFVDLQFEGPPPHYGQPPSDPDTSHDSSWPWGHDGTFQFSTAISIVPDTFPVDDCQGAECLGTLV